MIETNAVAPSARGAGSRSNFSISGKLTSTTERPVRRSSRDHVGQAMQRLRPEHEIDERRALGDGLALLARDAAAHADEHVRPLAFLSSRHSPSSENTFSCAFSRTEQVFMSSTSASAGSSVAVRPSAAWSASAIRAESYSFIWQPKVLMK